MSLQVIRNTEFVEQSIFLHSDGSASANVKTFNPLRIIQVTLRTDGTESVDIDTDSIRALSPLSQMLSDFVDTSMYLVSGADLRTYRALCEAVSHALD